MSAGKIEIKIEEGKLEDYLPRVEVAACYLERDGKFLFLQRADGKQEPGRWGVPAGKLEKGEPPQEAAVRELFEETGIRLDHPSQIQGVGSIYIRKPEVDLIFRFHLFKVQIDRILSVRLSKEHQNYRWATLQDLEAMPLMMGAMEILQWYLKR